jgi:hypothetical protein
MAASRAFWSVSRPLASDAAEAEAPPAAALTVRIDESSGGLTYLGSAQPGTEEGQARWRIARLSSGASQALLYAGGSAAFNRAWSLRGSYSYS